MGPKQLLAGLLVVLAGLALTVLLGGLGSTTARQVERRSSAVGATLAGPAADPEPGELLRPSERLPLPIEARARESSVSRVEPVPTPGSEPQRPPTAEELADFEAFADRAVAEVRAGLTADRLRELETRRARVEADLAEYERVLGLTADQVEELRDVLLLELDREVEYVLLLQNGASEQDVEHLRRTDREARRLRLTGFLDEKQHNGLDLRLGARPR